MLVLRVVLVLLAIAAIGFAGFVITDNVLSQKKHQQQKENNDIRTNQAPADSPNPDGQVGPLGEPGPVGPPEGGPGDAEGRDGGGRRPFDPIAFFKQRDADGDGKLSGDEISDRMRQQLDQIDTDKDGAISLKEWQERPRKRRKKGDGGRGGGRPKGDDAGRGNRI